MVFKTSFRIYWLIPSLTLHKTFVNYPSRFITPPSISGPRFLGIEASESIILCNEGWSDVLLSVNWQEYRYIIEFLHKSIKAFYIQDKIYIIIHMHFISKPRILLVPPYFRKILKYRRAIRCIFLLYLVDTFCQDLSICERIKMYLAVLIWNLFEKCRSRWTNDYFFLINDYY